MLAKIKEDTSGFTLVEVIISLLVLTVAALGITQFLISVQYSAEDNLYESTALNLALNALEQMKSEAAAVTDDRIKDQTFDLTVSANQAVTLNLEQANTIPAAIVSSGNNPRSIQITLTPSISHLVDKTRFLLRVEYQYEHPRNGRLRTKVLGSIQSRVPNRVPSL